MTGLTRNIEKGHVWVPAESLSTSTPLSAWSAGQTHFEEPAFRAHVWSCSQEACARTHRHTHRKGKRKSDRDEEKSIIIKLPANTDKLSAIPLKTYSFQYTDIYPLQSVSCLSNVRWQKYTHVSVSACCLPPSLGLIPTWCSHVSPKSSTSCPLMPVKHFQWTVSNG